MNIIRLTINQVSELWDSIRYGVIEAFSSSSIVPDSEMLQAILSSLLKEEMQCWCIYNDEKKIYGHIITSIGNDLNKKFLLIYSAHSFYVLPNRAAYMEVSNKLESFAKLNNCDKIIGYSMNSNIISLAEKMGYSSDQRVLVKEV
jgi:hypothetical protein